MRDERTTKHERVVGYLDAHGLDGVVLARRCNFAWYTGGAHNHVDTACDVGGSWLVVTRDGARAIATNIEAARLAAEELAETGIEVRDYPYHEAGAAEHALAEAVAAGRFAADAAVGPAGLLRLDASFDRLRWTLLPAEIERYRGVCTDTVAALEQVAASAEPGQTEHHLAGRLAEALRARGLLPWVLLVGADQRVERFRHPLPTDTPARRYFMLVTCAERGGLIAAATRLAHFGAVPQELQQKHAAVATVETALLQATRPGVTLGEIFAVAQEAYAAVGHADEWRLHHQGGSCGYLPREVKAAPGEKTAVLADQAFAWNPSIAGTKCEDTAVCTDGGCEPLAEPTDWPTVPATWAGVTLNRPAIRQL